MKIKLTAGSVLILLVILQPTLMSWFRIFGVEPDLVLAAVVIIGLSLDLKWVLLFSYAAGLLKDSLGILPLGVNTLVLPLLGFAANRLSRRMVIEADYVIATVVFIAAVSHNLIISLLLVIMGLNISMGMSSRIILIGAIYTASLFLLFSKLIRLSGIKFRS
jgi:rod shape-determining protein MreD